jgi:hypothetical protein
LSRAGASPFVFFSFLSAFISAFFSRAFILCSISESGSFWFGFSVITWMGSSNGAESVKPFRVETGER